MKLLTLTLLLFTILLSRGDISVFQNTYRDLSCSALIQITVSPANVCLPEETPDYVYSIKASIENGNYTSNYWEGTSNCTGTGQTSPSIVLDQCYSLQRDAFTQSWKYTTGTNLGVTLTFNDSVIVSYLDNNCTKLMRTTVQLNNSCTTQYPQNRGTCVTITDSCGKPAGAQYCGSDSVIQNINQNKSSITDISRPGQANSLHRVPLIFCLAIILLLVL
ncbi:hypothetical protein PROFUN_03972 [Planoprotostelium fungivorum]|uniref:Uncharacterized protein n=1 Tax=Planoprotostelium fungivorum TaxID=1890364 RepID=A0A2P6NW11_9EUKA|nr:hypothetical protein PROFUN_03972 [Planoprotostelium fungivorum]